MSRSTDSRWTVRPRRLGARTAWLVAGFGLLTAGGAQAERDARVVVHGPVSGRPYVEERGDDGLKGFRGPDGSWHETPGAIVRAERATLPPLRQVLSKELADLAEGPSAAHEPVVVTVVFRRQPSDEAGAAARRRYGVELGALQARSRAIVSRIAALRAHGAVGAAASLADVVREEERLLTEAERDELRRNRDRLHEIVAAARRETFDTARVECDRDQARVRAFVEASPGAAVLGSTVVLNALTARVPVSLLETLAIEFPEVSSVVRSGHGTLQLDTSAPAVGANTWWTAGWDGSASTKIAVIDTGIDPSHPAVSGRVPDRQVFHAVGSTRSNYNDSSSDSDDYYGHGMQVAGVAASADSTYSGVAPGARLMTAKAAWRTTTGTAQLEWSDYRAAGDWAADNGASVVNVSAAGSGTTDGTHEMTLFLDALAFSHWITSTVSAGNNGSSGVVVPADGYNVLAVGSVDDQGTTTASDDAIASTSSTGPASSGLMKPDIVAPGVSITTTAHNWEGSNSDFTTASGTSFAAPHVAGAVALLLDYGAASFPEGVRALLLGTTQVASAYSSAPDNTWGWGGLHLSNAYTCRASVYESYLEQSGPRFALLKAGSLAAGKRATLAWNRRVVAADSATPTDYSPLLDLDLYVYDESTGNDLGSSTSGSQSVEQVALSATSSSPVIKVYRFGSFPSAYDTEWWGVAAESSSATTLATGPALGCTFTTLPTAVAGTSDFTVSVRVNNTGDLKAHSPAVSLSLPTGFTVVSGSNPQTLSGIAASANGTATWTVRSSSGPSGSRSFGASASSASYDETFTSSTASASQTLDVDVPTGTVVAGGGATYTNTTSVALTLSASDALTGVPLMRVRDAAGAWGSWGAYGTASSVTLAAGDGTKTVNAQFQDGVGNLSTVATDTIVLDQTAPAGTVSIAGGAAYSNTSAVSVGFAASDATSGVADVRLSDDGTTWGAWTTYSATASRTLPAGEGTRAVHAQFRDNAGNVSTSVSDTIVVDTTAPTGTVVVAGGAAFSTTPTVTLTLSASDATSGVADMRFSDDGATWGSWTAFSATASRTMPTGDGTKTVHVQFRDNAGNVSNAATDTIVLDATAPSGTVTLAGGAAYTTGSPVTAALSATDATSGVADVRLSDDGVTWGAWQTYTTSLSRTLPGGDGTRSLHVQFRDVAGNVSATSADSIVVDGTAPSGSVTVAGGAAYTSATSVSLALSASDATSGVADVRLSADGATWSSWQTYSTSATWTLASGDGAKTVFAQFRDAAGNLSAGASDAVVLDQTAPSGTVAVESGRAAFNSNRVALALTSSDATSGVAQMRFSNDGATWSGWTSASGAATWDLAPGEGVRFAYAQFRDAAGNDSAPVQDAIQVDLTVPSLSFVVNADALYAMPWQPAVANVTAGDGATGSGVESFRHSTDGGTTWSSWVPLSAGAPQVALPASAGDTFLSVLAQVRDVAGNVSANAADPIHVVAAKPQEAPRNGTLSGAVAMGGDVDVFRIPLLAGEKLKVSVDGHAALRPALFLDLYGPDGTKLGEGSYPTGLPKAQIRNLRAPASGTYWVVLRAVGPFAAQGGAYKLTLTTVTPATYLKLRGTAFHDPADAAGTVSIPLQGTTSWSAAGTLGPTALGAGRLLSPTAAETPIVLPLANRGSVRLPKTFLTEGAGTYRLVVTSGVPLRYTLTLRTPPKTRVYETP